MSKDFSGARAVAGAKKRLADAAYDVVAAAEGMTRHQLRAFGRRTPKAVRRLREGAAHSKPERLEAAARALDGAARWSPAGLDEGDPQAVALATALLRLRAALKDLQVALQVALGPAGGQR